MLKCKKEKIILHGSEAIKWVIQHEFEHLDSPVYILRNRAYDANDNIVWLLENRYKPSKKDLLIALSNYDENMNKQLEQERIQEVKRHQEYLKQKAQEENFIKDFKNYPKVNVKEGDLIKVNMSSLSKPNDLGEAYFFGLNEVNVEIVKVIEISNEEWDLFSGEVLANDGMFDLHKENDKYIGGVKVLDDSLFDGVQKHSKEYFDIFRKHGIQLLNVLVSPNRPNIYVNSEGYSYARYVGFDI